MRIPTVFVLAVFMAQISMTGCSQSATHSEKKSQVAPLQAQPQPEEAAKIKTILSDFDPASLDTAMALKIHEKFREAGIHPGPGNREAIIAAGFDPDRLRDLAPPPGKANGHDMHRPTGEERLRMVEEKIIEPLALNKDQAAEMKKAWTDFFISMEKIRTADAATPPDRSLVEPLEKTRDEKVRNIIGEEKYSRYIELEKAARPPKPSRTSQPEGK